MFFELFADASPKSKMKMDIIANDMSISSFGSHHKWGLHDYETTLFQGANCGNMRERGSPAKDKALKSFHLEDKWCTTSIRLCYPCQQCKYKANLSQTAKQSQDLDEWSAH